MTAKVKYIILLLLISFSSFIQSQISYPVILWEAGKGEYASYRIPSIIEAPDKSLLAFCEGR